VSAAEEPTTIVVFSSSKMKKFAMLTLVALSLLILAEAQHSPKTCSWKDPKTGQHFDLSPLINNKVDYFLPKKTVANQDWDVWINVCRDLVAQTCGAGVAGCQQWDPKSTGGHAAMGTLASAAYQHIGVANAIGVTVQYTGGGGNRKMEIDFVCDSSVGTGMPGFTAESPPLHYNFLWKTKHACPVSSSGLSGGSIILIILLVLVVVYVVAGIMWQKFKVGATGKDLIPNFGFWSDLPHLVKDGFMFLVSKTCRRGHGDYHPVK